MSTSDQQKLRDAGFSAEHENAMLNTVYKKTSRMNNGRHVYKNREATFAWHYAGCWQFGVSDAVGTGKCFLVCASVSASPAGDATWYICEDQGTEQVMVQVEGINITTLNDAELGSAVAREAQLLSEAVEQAAPSFVLSGLPIDHNSRAFMGEYIRQNDREQVCERDVYKGPNGMWAWSAGYRWFFGDEEFIRNDFTLEEMITRIVKVDFCILESSRTAVPESGLALITSDKAHGFKTRLTVTAVPHKPAASFGGICTECNHCGEWRRCGLSAGCEKKEAAYYCSEACHELAAAAAIDL